MDTSTSYTVDLTPRLRQRMQELAAANEHAAYLRGRVDELQDILAALTPQETPHAPSPADPADPAGPGPAPEPPAE